MFLPRKSYTQLFKTVTVQNFAVLFKMDFKGLNQYVSYYLTDK